MRKLVTIRTIEAIEPIQGADAIEVAIIGGWKVVTKKGEFAVNDPCVYFEIDSFLPERDPRYSFLMKSVREFEGERGHRLRTIKLRGQISQGLALPVTAFPDIDAASEDIAETIGVKKWEPVMSAQLAGQAKGFFPLFIRKTDQERCQNLKAEIFGYEDSLYPIDVSLIPMESREAMIRRGELTMMYGEWMKVVKAKASPNDRYEITIKLDGSSCTIYHNNGEFGVCSRNLELKIEENPDNAMVRMLTPELRARLSEIGRNYAFQGEIMGPGIQGNRENLKEPQLFTYDVYDIDNGCYLGSHERRDIVSAAGLQHVPIICNNVLFDDLEIDDIKDLLEYAEGPSLNHPVREGVVFKRMDGGFSFKAISNSFLMKEKD
jgi:hypothetical protein